MQIHSGSFKSTAVTAFAAFAIGAVAWSGHLFTLLGLLALPIAFKCAKGTPQRITTLACYYAGSIWPIMPGAAQFFGNETLLHPLSIVILWKQSFGRRRLWFLPPRYFRRPTWRVSQER